MRCGELNLLTEEECYSDLVNAGQPVAVFKTRRNADGTYSNFVEMFNCSAEQAAFVQSVLDIRRVGGCLA
jgi:urocanate hydratase